MSVLIVRYKTLILDVDGVIFDTNQIKSKNIYEATSGFVSEDAAREFTEYFSGLNGVPREKKIFDYFKDEPEKGTKILNSYNELNQKTLFDAELTLGAKEFLQKFHNDMEFVALSGGSLDELLKLFEVNGIKEYFKEILGGPLTKEENLNSVKIERPVLFTGDSLTDLKTAKMFGMDFTFMWGYAELENWKEKIDPSDVRFFVKDLTELNGMFKKLQQSDKC